MSVNQNNLVLKILWCKENANINIQQKFHVWYSYTKSPKTKIDFVKKIPVFP